MFRPRISIGFGLWAGFPVGYAYFSYGSPYGGYAAPYPVPYSYSYPVPYPASPYPAPYATAPYPTYSAPPQTAPSVSVAPGDPTSGGISFEITPADALVYVDSVYAGAVGSFTPSSDPLMLTPGRHRIEIEAPGYQRAVFDVDIVAGQVIPYQGTLLR
jgi:hypothetical protein